MTDECDGVSDGPYVQSLLRGLAVLKCFGNGQGHDRLTISDVARETNLDRAASRRFLHTLVHVGYLGVDGRYFFVRPRVLELAQPFLSSLSFADVFQPRVTALAAEVGETTSVCVLDGTDIVYVGGIQAKRVMTINIRPGTRVPAYPASTGLAILAFSPASTVETFIAEVEGTKTPQGVAISREAIEAELAIVRQAGWSMSDQALEPGLRAIAAPIRDSRGRAIAAISIGVLASRLTAQEVRDTLVEPMLHAASEIEQDLAHVSAPVDVQLERDDGRSLGFANPAVSRDFPLAPHDG